MKRWQMISEHSQLQSSSLMQSTTPDIHILYISSATSNPEFLISFENMHVLLPTEKGSKAFEETSNLKEAVFVVANETCTKGS